MILASNCYIFAVLSAFRIFSTISAKKESAAKTILVSLWSECLNFLKETILKNLLERLFYFLSFSRCLRTNEQHKTKLFQISNFLSSKHKLQKGQAEKRTRWAQLQLKLFCHFIFFENSFEMNNLRLSWVNRIYLCYNKYAVKAFNCSCTETSWKGDVQLDETTEQNSHIH